ncbi:hypothetical protein AB0K18_39075 [Nonomuraea sp. NPDC049421]|uniref:hypothetical protein n=1 Tax=Nonomuraea sp. NPDC049421 TaxID=3155275 RepID=UPI0034413612
MIGTLTVVLILIVLAVLLISAVAMLVLLGLAASMARWRTARLRLHRLLNSSSTPRTAARPADAPRPQQPSAEKGSATATAPPSKPPTGPDADTGPETAGSDADTGPETAGSDADAGPEPAPPSRPDAEPGREVEPVAAAQPSAGAGLELKLCGEGVPERRRATLSRHAPRIRRRLHLGESEKSVSGRR